MAQTRGTFPALYDNIDKEITAILGEAVRELKPIWRQYFDVRPSERKFERVVSMVPFGQVPEKGEGEAYSSDIIRQGHTKDFTHTEFGMLMEVTETALEDDQYDVLTQHAKWLGYMARVTQEVRAANVLNNGFSTELTADGVSLFSTAHVLSGGGTRRNRLATDADLSANSLEQAVIDLQTETRLENDVVVAPITELVLVVPPALEFTAERIVRSTGRPSSADNDLNALKSRRNWTIIVNPYLTDSDAWFLLQGGKRHGLRAYERVPITIEPRRDDPRTGNRLYPVRFRISFGAAFWQGAFGSPGA